MFDLTVHLKMKKFLMATLKIYKSMVEVHGVELETFVAFPAIEANDTAELEQRTMKVHGSRLCEYRLKDTNI